MEFISNLIKRPISLVLSDAGAEQLHSINSSPTTTSSSSTTTSPTSSSAFTSPTSLSAANNSENCVKNMAMNNGNELHRSLDAVETADALCDAFADGEDLLDACNQLHSSTTSSNTTSTTIEELLIQINDNLTQATLLQGDVDAILGDANVAIELSTSALSPLITKTNTNKSAHSPRLHPQTPTTVAAGSAAFEANSNINKFLIDAELESGLFEENHLVFNNNNSGTVNKSNKFVGLTEFDEANIPELPECQNSLLEDPLKLTFDEDLIPTLNASSNALFNTTTKRDDARKPFLLLTHDTDTAPSSDNETYAECQSYPDYAANTTATIQPTTEMSEADAAYRSALNSNNSTVGNSALDATMENVADICNEVEENPPTAVQEQHWEQLVTSINGDEQCESTSPLLSATSTQSMAAIPASTDADDDAAAATNDVANVTFDGNDLNYVEDEPMDVDMNVTQELTYSTNVTADINQLQDIAVVSNSTQCIEQENNETLGALINVEPHQRLTYSLESTEQPTAPLLLSSNPNATMNVECLNEAAAELDAQSISTENLGLLQNASEHSRLTFSVSAAKMPTASEVDSRECIEAVDDAAHVLGNLANISELSRLTFCVNATQQSANEPESVQQSMEACAALNQTTTSTTSKHSDASIIQDNSVDSATDILPAICGSYDDENSEFKQTDFITSTAAAAAEVTDFYQLREQAMASPQPPHSSFKTPNLHLSLNTSMDRVKDSGNMAPKSPSFPIKLDMSSKEFPRSPDLERRSIFLEKSNYADSCHVRAKAAANLNETVDMCDYNVSTTPPSPTPFAAPSSSPPLPSSAQMTQNSVNANVLPSLNCTFEPIVTAPPSAFAELNTLAHNTETRRTFCLPPKATSPLPSPELNAAQHKRYTFNVPANANLNETVETMDVDVSLRAPSPAPATHSPAIPAKQQYKPRAATPPSMAPPRSPPIRNMQHQRLSTANAVDKSSLHMQPPELLSAKEITKCKVMDEKDIFVENFVPASMQGMFSSQSIGDGSSHTKPTNSSAALTTNLISNGTDMVGDFVAQKQDDDFSNEEFQGNLILNPSDFDYLLTKGNSNVQVDRSSLLLRFDPLLGVPLPVNQPPQQQLTQLLVSSNNQLLLSPTIEEDGEQHNESNRSFVVGGGLSQINAPETVPKLTEEFVAAPLRQQSSALTSQTHLKAKKNARMSVDVIKDIKIENDCNKSIEHINTQTDEKQNNFKMDDLEKKIKNEVLKTEDIEKKLKEAEQREEALIKRITEKDKTIAKMNSVIEAYEKAIAELISEKEQLIQSYERQMADVKADRDSNYHHLTSLETTFSDLHVKYEKSKEMTMQLKASEESLLADKKQNLENLRLQEQRYEKMRNHAMQQLEIANKKLESLTKEHAIESTKLKALLKKEEISRASLNEQLLQKTIENEELVKICDELINGQGS